MVLPLLPADDLRSVSALRLFLAIMVCGIGVAGAFAASNITLTSSHSQCASALLPDGSCPGPGSGYNVPGPQYITVTDVYRPGSVIPLSILIGFAGLAGAAAVLVVRRPLP